jgi:uncharacterized membrane protein YdjX (TVP38/TMEM64 family)
VKFSTCWRGFALILSLSIIGYVVHRLHLATLLDVDWINHWVRGKGLRGEMLYLLVGSVMTALGMPRQVIAFFAGYSFGITTGLLLAVLASVVGAALAFGYARLLARRLIQAHFPNKVSRMDAFTRDAPFRKTLAIRLLPVGNNLVTSLMGGVSDIPALAFLSGSAVGYVPQSLIFALAGSGVTVDPLLRIGTSMFLLLFSSLIAIGWYRSLQAGLAPELADPGSISRCVNTGEGHCTG